MSSVFCTSCGTKMDFAGVKPKFCSSCGNSMVIGGIAEKRSTSPKQGSVSLAEDETNYDSVPRLSKLEYECDYEGLSIRQHNLGQLLNEKESEEGQGQGQAPRKAPRKASS